MQEYDASPRIRSYMQRPVSETEKYVSDVSVPSFSMGQDRGGPGQDILSNQQLIDLPEGSEILIDRKIDPETYIVGPGDLINVYLWGELDKELPARVSPEGYVVIPTVGECSVADLSLKEAREIIREKIHSKYKGIDVSIYLLEPRRFRVFITGVLENASMYSAHSLLRVSDLLGDVITRDEAEETSIRMSSAESYERARAGLFTRRQFYTIGEKRGSSKRAIYIERNGKRLEVDLLKFEKMGEIDYNPYVSGGDHIHVPPYLGDIAISGEVNDEGIYEYKSGDTVSDLLAFGGGLTAVADTSNAVLVRFGDDGDSLINIPIDLYDATYNNPDDPKYLLKESDRLFVQTKFNYKVLANVTLEGQVVFPGDYAIIPQKTRLTDIIEMAGGFTDNANLKEARVIRSETSSLRDLEYERLEQMLPSEMTEEEYEYFKFKSRVTTGQISIDFEKLFIEGDKSFDMVLDDEDNIFIPFKRDLVNVLGAVQESGYIGFEDGQNAQFYITQAGGFSWNAKSRGVRIIKAKTGQRLRPSKRVRIEGGDTILVPEKQPIDWWQRIQDGMQVFANVATIIIIAERISE